MELFAVFPIIFAIVGVLVLAVMAYVIYAVVRNRRALRQAGHNPDTIQADLTNRVMGSDLLKGSTSASKESRLAEVDRLHAAGSISGEERDAARARILDS